METYSNSNTFILQFGQDHTTKAIPVHEREEKHAYKLPMRRSEKKVMLQKNWKLEPPLNKAQQTKIGPPCRFPCPLVASLCGGKWE